MVLTTYTVWLADDLYQPDGAPIALNSYNFDVDVFCEVTTLTENLLVSPTDYTFYLFTSGQSEPLQ
jgi:hypothetical protein